VAVRVAHDSRATLVPLALLTVPERRRVRGVRLDALQQAQDFLEAVSHKAAKYGVPVERCEVATHDIVKSIVCLASSKECEHILLFVRGEKGVLLSSHYITALIEQERPALWLVHLPIVRSGSHFARRIVERFCHYVGSKQSSPEGVSQAQELALLTESGERADRYPELADKH
ncbi:MAG: hypothetical protein JOZ18_08585, partial [Chloroflexi bacterium]|nr:hypothetical protein [Chloroflexota bacterium]